MILKRIHVKNFRSIKNACVNFGKQTAILGTNGAGKSTILRAIEKFYGPSTNVDPDDFFGRNLTSEIEIALTFHNFTESETYTFENRIHEGEMTVVRIFEATNPRTNGRYYGMTAQCPPFATIRAAPTATAKREAYARLRAENADYGNLPNIRSAEQLEQALLDWETAHPDDLQLARDDGQFFGFTNVGKGALQKATSFVFIPAVRDVSADAVDSRGAVIAKLMELVVRSAIQRKTEIQNFQAEVTTRFKELTDPSNLPELGLLSDNLTQTLQHFYADAGVGLKWKPAEDLSLPLPISEVLLKEDGFEGPVDRKGHGLQRAFIFTLLQHLAQASATPSLQNVNIDPQLNSDRNQVENLDNKSSTTLLPGLILAIEEPELYQHPTKQRHFAKVLTRLSDGSLPGVAAQTQIIFASHSSLFVSVRRFDEIRLARRKKIEDKDCKECVLLESDLSRVARKLDDAELQPHGTTDIEGLLARLHIMNSEISEGFFADGVVLVEGESDRAAIKAVAALHNFDPEEFGVAILPVDGKNNLCKVFLIFQELSIPVYMVWDCDSGSIQKMKPGELKRCREENRKLQRICGCAESEIVDFGTKVGARFSCLDDKLETCLMQEIGAQRYNELIDQARDKFGMRGRESILKSASAMEYVVSKALSEGLKCQTVIKIAHGIQQMRLDTYPLENITVP